MEDTLLSAKNYALFARESNDIERIYRDATQEELDELVRFVSLTKMSVEELEKFVSVYQPNAKLRDMPGMNVQINGYRPPQGSPGIRTILARMLEDESDPWMLHIKYEKLHPFMDGNGRSGRALWAWAMKRYYYLKEIPPSFLREFYFQTLGNSTIKWV